MFYLAARASTSTLWRLKYWVERRLVLIKNDFLELFSFFLLTLVFSLIFSPAQIMLLHSLSVKPNRQSSQFSLQTTMLASSRNKKCVSEKKFTSNNTPLDANLFSSSEPRVWIGTKCCSAVWWRCGPVSHTHTILLLESSSSRELTLRNIIKISLWPFIHSRLACCYVRL